MSRFAAARRPLCIRLDRASASPKAARDEVGRAVAPVLSEDKQHDVVLLVSELVTNALIHAGPPVDVEVKMRESSVRVDVKDRSPFAPRARHASDTETTGRGLRLVDCLATRWGVDRTDDGKSVWFEVPAG